jgi:glutathione S-transferase
MLLIGQFDSPFVRRVAIALGCYGIGFEHAPWSTFGDADRIAAYNPLIRVPTLVMDDGVVLTDSAAILEVLDAMVGPDRASLNRPAQRRDLLRLCALAAGVADKGVSLLYERRLRDQELALWVERCRAQIGGALAALEAERAARRTAFLFDDALSHADVLLATMLNFLSEALPEEFDIAASWPALAAHSARCEALPLFRNAYQPYRLAPPKEAADA